MGPAKKIGWLWSADSQEKLTGEAHSAVSVLAQRACGAPGHKASLFRISLITGNTLLSVSKTFPGLQGADSVGEGRGCKTREKQTVKNSLGARSCFPGNRYTQQVHVSGSVLSNSFPSGSSVHGIFQARILEWVAIFYSRGFSPTQGSNPSLLHGSQIVHHLTTREAP